MNCKLTAITLLCILKISLVPASESFYFDIKIHIQTSEGEQAYAIVNCMQGDEVMAGNVFLVPIGATTRRNVFGEQLPSSYHVYLNRDEKLISVTVYSLLEGEHARNILARSSAVMGGLAPESVNTLDDEKERLRAKLEGMPIKGLQSTD